MIWSYAPKYSASNMRLLRPLCKSYYTFIIIKQYLLYKLNWTNKFHLLSQILACFLPLHFPMCHMSPCDIFSKILISGRSFQIQMDLSISELCILYLHSTNSEHCPIGVVLSITRHYMHHPWKVCSIYPNFWCSYHIARGGWI